MKIVNTIKEGKKKLEINKDLINVILEKITKNL